MASYTVVKTIGTTGDYSTPQLWEDGAPASLTTAEKSACSTFLVANFIVGETLTFVQAGTDPVGVCLETDNSTYMVYGITSGNPASSAVITGSTSGGTCVLISGTADNVGVIWQGQCQNQEFSGTGIRISISGSTASSTAYKYLTSVAGASFMDNVNVQTNALKYNTSNGCGLRSTNDNTITCSVGEANATIRNLQIASDGAGTSRALQFSQANLISNCIMEGKYTGTSATLGVLAAVGNGTVTNSLIVLRASTADHIIGTGTSSPNFYNVTVVAPDDLAAAPTSVLLSGASGTVTVQNCGLFAGHSTKAIKAGSATFNFTTCYSDISGTTGVTQTTYSSEFQNVNDATRDFRLKSGAAQIDTGTTDSTNAANDIAGTARPSGAAYDVGCWELVVVSAILTYITAFILG